MTTDIIDINNFVVLIEQSDLNTLTIERCHLNDRLLGIAFYATANVDLEIQTSNEGVHHLNHKSGFITSFIGQKQTEFIHKVHPDTPLFSVTIFTSVKNIHKLPQLEKQLFFKHLINLINNEAEFALGKSFNMTPQIQETILKIFKNNYKSDARKMFLHSQVLELLSHFFAFLNNPNPPKINLEDQEKMQQVKEIISNNMSHPPALSELSKMIGVNNTKLKRNFKELFGVTVYSYLQHERLTKAYELLSQGEQNVQEVAWYVGYESLSSFSNAFTKKFGMRPSEVK